MSKAKVALLAAVALAAATSTQRLRAQQPDPSTQTPQGAQAPQAPQTTQAPQTAQPPSPAGTEVQTPFTPNRGESPEYTRIVDTIVARENQLLKNLRTYGPRIETYIQEYKPDPELGSVPVNDHYFL